jgi:hypothetical protein
MVRLLRLIRLVKLLRATSGVNVPSASCILAEN